MDRFKVIFIMFTGAVFSSLNILALPMLILLQLNIIDYITGFAAAKYRDTESERPIKSYKSFKGIYKKVTMYILIFIGGTIDILLDTSLQRAGFTFSWPQIFGVVIACWLIFNEIISIIENIDDTGAPIPPFLLPITKIIKSKITLNYEDENEDRSNKQ